MIETATYLDETRETALRHIEESRVAGRNTRHNRSANLQAIRGLIEGEPHYTFGIKGVEHFSFEEVLEAIASITKCSRDPSETTGGGYISPNSTLKGLEQAAQQIISVARAGGKFLLGTGHAGSMLLFYVELAKLIRRWGGEVLEPERGALVPPNLDLDYIGSCAVTTDRCSLLHTHDYRAMEIMLKATPHVDLVVADHGYAGAAINAGIPVVTVMDTNDPAVAVAKRYQGADVIIVPMDDNRPLSCYLPIVETLRVFAEGTTDQKAGESWRATNSDGTERAASGSREDHVVNERLQVAERLISERAGPAEALNELVMSLVRSYRDQFLQTHFGPDEDERLAADPMFDLVIYKRLHDALRCAALDQLRLAEVRLSHDEIIAYMERGQVLPCDREQRAA